MDKQLTLFPGEKESFKVAKVIKRNGRIVAFDREKIANAIFKAAIEVGGSNRERPVKLAEKVIRMMNHLYPAGTIPSVEEIQDIIEKVLIENGHARTAKAYILYRAEHARMREKKEAVIAIEDNIPYKLVWKVFNWNVEHDCDTVEKLNKQMQDGRWKKLVHDSEKYYHDEIKKVTDIILKKKKDLRILIVAGPSSSGKTSATLKIGERLKEEGISFVALNLDNYFNNLETHPKDEYGDYDFESPHALDLKLINEHLSSLLNGKTIHMPFYDFKTGVRKKSVEKLRLKKGEILLIDSLHGLYSDMTKSVSSNQKFKFYIEAVCQIKDLTGEFVRWADLRMLRRMIRDSWHRSYGPEETVGHWHYVRRSEKKHIVPFIRTVDFVFNGSLPYELPVHKNFMEKHMSKILKKYESDPKRVDAFIRAQRVNKLLLSLRNFPDIASIPGNSFLREFIGNSIYKY